MNNYWNSEESIKRYARMKYRLYDVEQQYLDDAVRKLGKKPIYIKILDLGCGGGRTTIPLKRLGFDVYGLDIAEDLINILKSKHPRLNVSVGDAAKLKFKNKSFDIVLFSHNSLDCLYPFAERKKALDEINRVLKKNGIFIFSSHIFNFIPFNFLVFKNIILNFKRWGKLINRGYYKEHMANGNVVELFSSSLSAIQKELDGHGFSLLNHSRIINRSNNPFFTVIRSFLNWERYYFAIKC